ncbi:hypothetical protein ACFL1S_06585 [Pseudomonadota bacterium]
MVRAPKVSPEQPEIKYKYVGFDHETYANAVETGYRILDELACQPNVWAMSTSEFPANSGIYMRDNVHLTDAGLAALVEIIAPGIEKVLIEPNVVQRDGIRKTQQGVSTR